MNLGEVTTQLVSVLATLTGLPVGDGDAPAAGVPGTVDHPYLVVYDITDTAVADLGRWAPGSWDVVWQITAVGRTRAQACAARDRARGVLDPAVAISTSEAAVSGRWDAGSMTDRGEGGTVWSAALRIGGLVAEL